MVSGLGYYDADFKERIEIVSSQPIIIDFEPTTERRDIRHRNAYLYTRWPMAETVTTILGASYDGYDDETVDARDQLNPKLGILWQAGASTTVRAALVRLLTRTLIGDQTIEPTQVAGFNQFFDDVPGADTWMYGAAVDQKFSSTLFGGIEAYQRLLDAPYKRINLEDGSESFRRTDWEEVGGRTYLNWAPHRRLAARIQYLYEHFNRDRFSANTDGIVDVDTHRIQLGGKYFHPGGFFAEVTATYVYQEGEFENSLDGSFYKDDDRFWVFDAGLGYRLPKRLGTISISAKNLLDQAIRFLDTDPANPTIASERRLLGRVTLAF